MAILAFVALGVGVVSALGGAAFAAVRALRAWRAFRRARRTVGAGLREIVHGIDAVEARVSRAGDGAARLMAAQGRLQESLATLGVLRAAASDAGGPLRALSLLRG